ncbi:MAG: hypothetical protein ACAI25_07365 [Planctomycetota bacterium]
MRNVLSTLLIAVVLSVGAHSLWACGHISGQQMTPAQVETYKTAITTAVLNGQTPPLPSDVFGSGTLNQPAGLPSFDITGESTSSQTAVKHSPTANIVVLQIDLVPDISGELGPDGNCTPQVM